LAPDEVFESFKAVDKTDSITIDPHKLGYIPYPCGAIIFRNEGVKDLISFRAPVIFREEEQQLDRRPFIGQYILEGSKPGAAAASCWLAHKVVPLNQQGYGKLIGSSIQSAYHLYLKCAKDLAPKLEQTNIKLHVLTDPPDINVLCFIVNQIGNQSLREMNAYNDRIYNKLSFNPDEVLQTHQFIISKTDLGFDQYGISTIEGKTCMASHLRHLRLDDGEIQFKEEKKVTILRCTVMSPWISLSRGSDSDYVFEFSELLKESITTVIYPIAEKLIDKYKKENKNWFESWMTIIRSIKKMKLDEKTHEQIADKMKSEFPNLVIDISSWRKFSKMVTKTLQ
jgi:hypothetical protein